MGGVSASVSQEDARPMHHRTAPLTVVESQRAVAQAFDSARPVSHVAAEFHVARTPQSKWVGVYRDHGELGLEDRSPARRRPCFT